MRVRTWLKALRHLNTTLLTIQRAQISRAETLQEASNWQLQASGYGIRDTLALVESPAAARRLSDRHISDRVSPARPLTGNTLGKQKPEFWRKALLPGVLHDNDSPGKRAIKRAQHKSLSERKSRLCALRADKRPLGRPTARACVPEIVRRSQFLTTLHAE